MYKFDTRFDCATAVVAWFEKCADGSLTHEEGKKAFVVKNKIQDMLKPNKDMLASHSAQYQQFLANFKRSHPQMDLKNASDPEVQVKFNEFRETQKNIGNEIIHIELEQKDYLAMTRAVESILKSIYAIFEKKNKGEKFDGKTMIPTAGDYSLVLEFEENLLAADKTHGKKEKK